MLRELGKEADGYPRLKVAPNLAGKMMTTGRKEKLARRRQRPREKKRAKFFQLVVACWTSCILLVRLARLE